MTGFVLRRVGAALIVLFLASILVFAGVRALPGDPVLALAGEQRDPAVLQQIRHKYGFDQPVPVQYVKWLGNALQGDLGTSTKSGLPVSQTILDRIPITLELAALSVLFAVVLGVSAGIIAAVKRGSLGDYASSSIALFGLSIPHFWLGLMLILLFAVQLRILPASGYVPFFDDP